MAFIEEQPPSILARGMKIVRPSRCGSGSV